MNIIERFLDKPHWVIDFLPQQVPANSKGQYFKIEEFFLKQPRFGVICRKFCHILMKLNCYYDFSVYDTEQEKWDDNPSPEYMADLLTSGRVVFVVLPSEDAMIGFNGDNLYMTLYNPKTALVQLVASLANAEGLYVWKPANHD